MAISITNLGTNANPDINSNTDATSYANSSWTPATGLLICFVSSRVANTDASAPPNIPTISGNSLTWTQIQTVTFNLASSKNRFRITLFAVDNTGGSATTGATTFDFAGQTQVRCNVSFFYATGVNVSGGVASAFVQSPTNTGTGVTSLSITLSAAGNSNNRPISGFAHNTQEDTTPRTNWTEIDDAGSSTPLAQHQTQWRSDTFETTASASWATSGDVGGIAAELKAITSTNYTKSITDSEGITDSNTKIATFVRSFTTTEAITDSKSKVVTYIRAFTDSENITDTTSRIATYIRSFTDSEAITDLISTSVGFIVSISNTLGITDSVIGRIVRAAFTLHLLGSKTVSTLRGTKSSKLVSGTKAKKHISGTIDD